MARGQAERLIPLLEEMLEDEGFAWGDLTALAVGVGPGNFTGIRISVSAARGLAQALKIPAIGISTFEIMRGPASFRDKTRQLVSVPAPRDHLYLQMFEHGMGQGKPVLGTVTDVPQDLDTSGPFEIVGHEGREIAHLHSMDDAEITKGFDAQLLEYPGTIARIAADKMADPSFEPTRPAPLYVRAPDAAPPRDPAPVILPDPQ